MNILILGGTGSIGCALVKILKNTSCNVVVTSRKAKYRDSNISYVEGNAHEKTFLETCLKMEKWDAIVDFMAYGTEEFAERYELFLDSTSQYFFLSSSRVYAESSEPITEDSPRLLDVCEDEEYLKTDEYALAKARQENILFESQNRNWTILRPYKTYNVNRMQLGMFEKENWLYRVLMDKTLAFPKSMAGKRTTLTLADDVAAAIKELIGNNAALGEAFHITSSESITWEEIINNYQDIIEKRVNKKMKFQYVEDETSLYKVWNKYQIMYDCDYDRIFDNTKIQNATGGGIDYTRFSDGCDKCLTEFLSKPVWKGINWKVQFWMDNTTGDKSGVLSVIGAREKLRYIKASFRK